MSLPVEFDEPLTAEEEAEVAQEQAAYEQRLEQGQRCDLQCANVSETLMSGVVAAHQQDVHECTVDRAALPRDATVVKRLVEPRRRIDLSLEVTHIDVLVEKLVVETPKGSSIVSASVEDLGPPKMLVTWDFLVNIMLLASRFGVPFNRLAMMTSSPSKRFTAGEIGRYFVYGAERFVPIYVQLAHNVANASALSGDDTPSRVLEVNAAFKARQDDPNLVMPWSSYGSIQQAQATADQTGTRALGVILAKEFGFSFDKKDGTGAKIGLNTTVLSGRSDEHDPRSTIVFYRSHLGSLGNLLDVILTRRSPNNTSLVIQSDLSTTNLLSTRKLVENLQITYAGCASHARRPFVQNENDEPEICGWIRHAFVGLSIYEQSLTAAGRNADNTLAVRGVDGLKAWETIRECCELLIPRWPSKSPLGDGARYVLRHYDKLTYYLRDPRVSPSNNFSERQLRMEKIIGNNALFRKTLHGRFALDIVRTVLQTAVAAKVNVESYLKWVMKMPSDAVAAEPQQFTPLSFAHSDANRLG